KRIHSRIPASHVDVGILGQPLTFRSGRTAQNRFLKAALTERISTWDAKDPSKRGVPSQELVNLYDKWGHGRFGVTLTGNVCVEPNHLESVGNVIFSKENDSPKLREMSSKLAEVIKQDGALAVVQLSHGGRQTQEAVNMHPFSCSDIAIQSKSIPMRFGTPIALTEAQVKTEVVDRFVYAAKFAYEHGFDGVQLHAAHGYLLSSFLSPMTNNRKDKYGGSAKDRMTVILEIYEGIRREIASNDFLLGIKMNSIEFQDRGLGVEDAKITGEIVEKCGFDFVELSGGTVSMPAFHHQRESTRKREAFFAEFAEQIRPSFDKTVVYLTGGFRTTPAMIRAITDGITDGIGLGRPITAEPDLPAKILGGQCLSAPATKLDEDDFVITLVASLTQMWQMGRRPYADLKNVCDDIADLSHPKEVENFMKKALPFFAEATKAIERREPTTCVMEYENIVV
ncbi:hypothetical protein V3C99_002046, partial [Haemonchus contortus]